MMAVSIITYTLVFLELLCLAICYSNSDDHVLCVGSEREVLLSFKQGLKDPSNRLSSWSASQVDCCKWIGIVCHNLTGHVKELNLSNPMFPVSNVDPWGLYTSFKRSTLQGNISSRLLDLKHMNYLDLSYNDFGGIPIPSFIGSMVSLTCLNLSEAGFVGLIPHQLGNLSHLHHLVIQTDYNFYNGYHKLYVDNLNWLSRLPSLIHLDFSMVNLSAVSDWMLIINKLPSLLELHLFHCDLPALSPLSTVNFTSLQILRISSNHFNTHSIPKWILSLNNLISLDLSSNHFHGLIPSGFSNLTSLKNLDLSSNYFLSPLPKWLFTLDGLVSLNLRSNSFEGPIPIGLKNMTGLRNIDLSDIDFATNTIPEWLYTFQYLESLDLSFTNLKGEISSAIQNMTSLNTLYLYGNEIEVALPSTMGKLCNLKVIDLQVNYLGGEILKALESLFGCLSNSLESLILAYNNFSGQIPESLGRLSSLTSLNLANNQLTGTLPKSMGNLSNVQELDISNNLLGGFVTEGHFTNLTNLRTLKASHNHLNFKVSPTWVPPFRLYNLELKSCNLGPQFPMWLKSQDYFLEVDLSCNGISDSIPTWFWNLSSHSNYLNLSHNQIQGELPSYLGIESYDVMIYLGSNQFKGPLPRISADIAELDLSNNLLSGGISRLLCDPVSVPNRLTVLHLGENLLTGEIPNCWMNWQSLEVIKLGNNNLTGKIPISIGDLQNLMSLHLRNNSLSGKIPSSLGKCKSLLILDLGLNEFVGQIPAWLGTNLPSLIAVGFRSNQFNGQIPSEFCHLVSLHILDLANNNLSGSIPKCFNNLTAIVTMMSPDPDSIYYLSYSSYDGVFFDEFLVVIKGREFQYDTTLTLLTSIDISDNELIGDIPAEITALLRLTSSNLSGNHLTGEIPKNIGDMRSLESLDLSRNKLFGRIPSSMSSLNFLSYLNVSYNNLSGKIPSSTHLQSLNASGFIGNKLCGPPLKKNCSTKVTLPESKSGNEKEGGGGTKVDGFFLSVVLGFVVGFWGVCGPLLYSRSWRHTYFLFLSKTWRRLCDGLAYRFSKCTS